MKGAYLLTGAQAPQIVVATSLEEALGRARRAWRDAYWWKAEWLGPVMEYADMPDVPQP